MKRNTLILCAALAGPLALASTANVGLTISGAGVQTSADTNLTARTQNFDALSASLSSYTWTGVGQFSAFKTLAANSDGGAGGAGRYAAVPGPSRTDVGPNSSLTLNLYNQTVYTGFWWSAGGSSDTVTFNNVVNGVTTQVAQFTTGDIVAVIGNGPYPAPYYGNPNNTALDRAFPFAYVNIFSRDPNSVSWNQIVFSEGYAWGVFEFDNLTVDTAAVSLFGTQINATQVVPEPSTYGAVGLAALALAIAARRKRRA